MTRQSLATAQDLETHIKNAAAAIVSLATNPRDIILIGIQTRGVPLSERIAAHITATTGVTPRLCRLDITFYRDDLSQISRHPVVHKTEIPVSLDGAEVFVIDDVLHTGRTIRAAMDAIIDFGRPSVIRLLVIVDRGGRELPIQADWVAITHVCDTTESIELKLKECDDVDRIDRICL